jgi:hypothetical protein
VLELIPISRLIGEFVEERKRISAPSVGEIVSVIGPLWGYSQTLLWIAAMSANSEPDPQRINDCYEAVSNYLASRKTPFPATVDEIVSVLYGKYPLDGIAIALAALASENPFAPLPPLQRSLLTLLKEYLSFRAEINAPATTAEILSVFAPTLGAATVVEALLALLEEGDTDGFKAYKALRKYLKRRKSIFPPTVNEIYDHLVTGGFSPAEAVDAISEAFYDGLFFVYLQPTFKGGAAGDEGTSALLC